MRVRQSYYNGEPLPALLTDNMTLKIGERRILLDSVESTNNYVAEQLESGRMADGTVIMAVHQYAGRGQRGNTWEMQPGLDLAMSIPLRPKWVEMSGAFLLNKAIALSVRSAIAEQVQRKVRIKWPNDILIDGMKVAGILIEMSWQGSSCQRAICGIGVNLSSKRQGVTEGATSILDFGVQISTEDMCDSICKWADYFIDICAKNQAKEITSSYHSALAWRDEVHLFSIGEERKRMKVIDVDNQGRLILEDDKGQMAFAHGAIKRVLTQSL